MQSKRVLVYLFISIFFSCGNNEKVDSNKLSSESIEENIQENKPNSIELLNQANVYFKNYQIEESKKNLLILLKKYPKSKEAIEAKELLFKADLELEKMVKIEDSLFKETERKDKLNAEKVTRDFRKKIDDLEGITWYYDKTSPRYTNLNGFYLYIGDRGHKAPWLRLRIQYKGDNWLFIAKYIIYVDGLEYRTIIPEYGDVKRDNGYGGVWEWTDILVNSNRDEMIDDFTVLRAIIRGKDVKVKFVGKTYVKTIIINNNQKKAIKNVLEAYEALGGKTY